MIGRPAVRTAPAHTRPGLARQTRRGRPLRCRSRRDLRRLSQCEALPSPGSGFSEHLAKLTFGTTKTTKTTKKLAILRDLRELCGSQQSILHPVLFSVLGSVPGSAFGVSSF